MTLLAPSRLWLLAACLALVVAYVALQRRRRHHAVRHPDLALVAAAAPKRAGWRRHLSAATLLLAIVALVVGLARPASTVEVPRKEAVVVLALDISKSMTSTDVAPSRLQAAVAAAKKFIRDSPAGYRIGLVTFDYRSHIRATPTTNKDKVLQALDGLQTDKGTSAGEGLFTALDVLQSDKTATNASPAGAKPYRAIVQLADGGNNVGRSLDSAAQAAAKQKIPVFTIAYGSTTGTINVDGKNVEAPADPAGMARVSTISGGQAYTATTAAQLSNVYDRIGTTIGHTVDQQELTLALAVAAAICLTIALGTSMLWSPRLV
ncbi:MAG: von Willebrand factor type [Acidimicrobiales bacterium]|nr:von Willebrand factor type [Acidimicrobiales bacterium]